MHFKCYTIKKMSKKVGRRPRIATNQPTCDPSIVNAFLYNKDILRLVINLSDGEARYNLSMVSHVFNELTVELADKNWQGYLAQGGYVERLIHWKGDYHNFKRHNCRYLGPKNAARGGCWALLRKSKLYLSNKTKALIGASRGGHLDMVKWLVETKKANNSWRLALIAAIKGNHMPVITYYLDHWFNRDNINSHLTNQSSDILDAAYYVGNQEVINRIELIFQYAKNNDLTRINASIRGNHIDRTYKLLQSNDRDNMISGESVGINGSIQLLEDLQAKGYHIDIVWCLVGAYKANNREMIEYCLPLRQALEGRPWHIIPIQDACRYGYVWLLEEVLRGKTYCNYAGSICDGLETACAAGNASIVSYLLDNYIFGSGTLTRVRSITIKKYRFDITDLLDKAMKLTGNLYEADNVFH